jgi:hypothetical protein
VVAIALLAGLLVVGRMLASIPRGGGTQEGLCIDIFALIL